jgi:cellulose synthase/poly-beta-1,6-N-acetylglucosamine synthase-like glycosyltransferase
MADNQPLVSICLPVHDGESSIAATLESAIGQTYGNTEIVVVDDGSRDGTRAIVEAWIARDPRIRLIAQANRGVAAARNRAVEAARGELIAPLDADDLWDPTKIERQVRRLFEVGDGTGLVYCWWVTIDDAGVLLDSSPRWQFEGDGADTLLQVNFTGNASVPLYRRRDLVQVGGYDVTLRERDAEGSEDLDVALKVAERSRVAVVPSCLVAYRKRRSSMSLRTDRMWRSHAFVIESARQRRPGLRPAVVSRSGDQLALHLAGLSFWSGAYRQAGRWGLRAMRSGLALQALPYVVRSVSGQLLGSRRPTLPIIGPGVRFSSWNIPRALIPYDRIYQKRLAEVTAAASTTR